MGAEEDLVYTWYRCQNPFELQKSLNVLNICIPAHILNQVLQSLFQHGV